jgi:uncharacterized membrane protein
MEKDISLIPKEQQHRTILNMVKNMLKAERSLFIVLDITEVLIFIAGLILLIYNDKQSLAILCFGTCLFISAVIKNFFTTWRQKIIKDL